MSFSLLNPWLSGFDPYRRRLTRTVFVGAVAVGGNNPIRIQSMTTADTRNTEATLREIAALVKAGCEIVRLTVPTKADCDNLKNIRKEMLARHLYVPLVADIHFTPSIAMAAVDYVEKIRINPGNFVDKKLFKEQNYSDAEYASELLRIEEKFAPLVLKCQERGISMRVGTNHGSLSDRIMNRYGDTPEGMVESALEFLRIAARLNYHDMILSMKASNTQIMVAAYRLLAQRLAAENMDYPFHLGVTEAGEGEDGRIKSAIGIGTLLEEGIGDTIRVSLTEDSEHEIPVATMLAAPDNARIARQYWNDELHETKSLPKALSFLHEPAKTFIYQRRETQKTLVGHHDIGASELPRVWLSLKRLHLKAFWDEQNEITPCEGVELNPDDDFIPAVTKLFGEKSLSLGYIHSEINKLASIPFADKLTWIIDPSATDASLLSLIQHAKRLGAHLEFCLDETKLALDNSELPEIIKRLVILCANANQLNIGFSALTHNPLLAYRILAKFLDDLPFPAVLHLRHVATTWPRQLDASVQLGGLLLDGLGDSVQIMAPTENPKTILNLSFGILQGARIRTSKTEYISCPSCGRTLFHLQETTEKIRQKTDHLKGVKIAVMGCIVNGPGEMADADFGYVGTGVERISLYVGKVCVERNIPQEAAVSRLVGLIREHGRWIDPPLNAPSL
jgi:(E)-4-hydroxy-3-methylbut-2-enyl-diphosphate synthase